MKTRRNLHVLAQMSGDIRTASFEGREHVVVPVTALVEGVIFAVNAETPELVLASEFSKTPSGWNGRPVVHNHPMEGDAAVSANSPKVLDQHCFGRVFNARAEGKRLLMDAWLDTERAERVAGGAQMIERILAGKTVEVSVGAFVNAEEGGGTHAGKPYKAVWREIVPDHLAFLQEGLIGACSVKMGCGARHLATALGYRALWPNSDGQDDHGRGEGGGGRQEAGDGDHKPSVDLSKHDSDALAGKLGPLAKKAAGDRAKAGKVAARQSEHESHVAGVSKALGTSKSESQWRPRGSHDLEHHTNIVVKGDKSQAAHAALVKQGFQKDAHQAIMDAPDHSTHYQKDGHSARVTYIRGETRVTHRAFPTNYKNQPKLKKLQALAACLELRDAWPNSDGNDDHGRGDGGSKNDDGDTGEDRSSPPWLHKDKAGAPGFDKHGERLPGKQAFHDRVSAKVSGEREKLPPLRMRDKVPYDQYDSKLKEKLPPLREIAQARADHAAGKIGDRKYAEIVAPHLGEYVKTKNRDSNPFTSRAPGTKRPGDVSKKIDAHAKNIKKALDANQKRIDKYSKMGPHMKGVLDTVTKYHDELKGRLDANKKLKGAMEGIMTPEEIEAALLAGADPDDLSVDDLEVAELPWRELVDGFLTTAEAYEPSDSELRRHLEVALRTVVPGFVGVDSVFPDSKQVVYAEAPNGDLCMYRADYTLNAAGAATIATEGRVKVKPVTRFEEELRDAGDGKNPMAKKHGLTDEEYEGSKDEFGDDEEANATMAEKIKAKRARAAQGGCGCGGHKPAEGGDMTKAERIAALIAAGKTPFKAAQLETLSDDMLKTLEDAPAVEVKETKIETPAVKELTQDEMLAKMPDIKALVDREAVRAVKRRGELVTLMAATKQEAFTEDELKAMPLEQLEKLATLAGTKREEPAGRVDHGLQPVPRAAQNGDEVPVAAPVDMFAKIRAAREKKTA